MASPSRAPTPCTVRRSRLMFDRTRSTSAAIRATRPSARSSAPADASALGGLQRGGGLGQLLLAAVDPLAQGAGRGVARVGERRATQGQLLVVDPLEVGHGEEHLAPDLDQRRHGRIIGRGQPCGDRGDELRVVGDVLPHATIAARGHRHQAPGPVDDVDRQPVDLQLAQHRREPVDRALHPLRPRRQLVVGEGVVQRVQPLEGARPDRTSRPATRRPTASGSPGSRSSGCSASSATSSANRASYSASEIVGASCW